MSVTIRRAEAADAAAVAEIAQEAFGDSIDLDYLAKALEAGSNFVALADGRAQGFAGGFVTVSGAGGRRFELDLLAVAAAARGMGLGTRLVQRSVEAASAQKVDVIRALVATGNLAMQRILGAAGFQRDEPARQLYARDLYEERVLPGPPKPSEPAAHLVAVDTLSYRGIWLEGQLSQAAIDEALARASQTDRSRVGAVIRRSARGEVKLLRANDFSCVGDYDWWTLKPGNARS